jgi:hypothetical protein
MVSRHERTFKEKKWNNKVVFDSAFSRQQLLNKQSRKSTDINKPEIAWQVNTMARGQNGLELRFF